MAEKLSLRTDANGNIYVYVEDTAGASLAFGADSSNGVVALNTSSAPNVQPAETTANMTIDPAANGDILFRPHGTGKSEFNTGNVQITQKSLYLPHTSNDGADGCIFTNDPNLGYQRTISFPDDWNIYIGKGVGGVGTYPNVVGVGYNVIIGAEGSFNIVANPSLHNIGIGQGTFQDFTGGSSNIAIGRQTLSSIVSGSLNVALGHASGSSLTTNDSNNICISSTGSPGDNGAIRIGTSPTQSSAFIQGIHGVTPGGSNIQNVVIDDNGQLGTGTPPVVAVAFSAYNSTDVPNVTGDGTAYTAQFDTTTVNISSSFNTGTGVFTAPITGLYQFNVTIATSNLTLAHNLGQVVLITTQHFYISNYSNWGIVAAGVDSQYIASHSQLAPMNAGDTAFVNVGVYSSTLTVTYVGGDTNSAFSGYLLPTVPTTTADFSAYVSGDIGGVTGDGTFYSIVYDVPTVNDSGSYNSGTGVFTAPTTGLYQFNVTVGVGTLGVVNTLGLAQLVTSQHTYISNYSNWGVSRAVNNIFMASFSQLAPMDSGDTAFVQLAVFGDASPGVTLYGGDTNTAFSGFLVG